MRSPAPRLRLLRSLPLLLALAGPACSNSAADTPEVEFRIPVEAAEVGTDTVEDLIVTTGTMRTHDNVVLNVETPGLLVLGRDESGNRLAEGSTVAEGQLIAEITGEEARLAAGIEASRRRLENAGDEMNRRRTLFERGLIAEEELRRAEVEVENARLAYDQSQLTEDKSRITTPIAGVLLELARDEDGRPVADGQLVAPGFEIARVASIDRLIADIDLVGPELARIRTGQAVRIRHYAFEDAALTGTILRLAPSMDPETHTFRAEVDIDNAGGLLRPGMFVEAVIVVARRAGVPVVPREAITERAGRSVVFVLDGQRVALRNVSLGLGDDDQAEVLEGVEPGERLVVRGLETLTDGTRVRVVDAP